MRGANLLQSLLEGSRSTTPTFLSKRSTPASRLPCQNNLGQDKSYSDKMVKADPSCDYYAALECKPGADAADIKKHFRNLGKITWPKFVQGSRLTCVLAMKYHPDRNPGKEQEFKDKFQAIQAAHEVLTDPQQKAKYDADRLRQGAFATNYNTPTRPDMPPRGATTAFGPPPRRTAPASMPTANTAGTKPFYPTPGATGTSRYGTRTRSGYPPYEATDTTPKQSDHYKTFQNMRQPREKFTPNGKTPRPAQPPFSPSSDSFSENTRSYVPKTPGGERRSGAPPGWQDPRKAGSTNSKDGWDGFVREHQAKHQPPPPPPFGRSNTTRLPKKNGFAPSMSGPDEPPARNTSAYHHVNRPPNERIHTQFPPPPGPPPTSRSRPPSPDRPRSYHSPPSDDLLGNSDRIKTPYATSGGERTYLSSQDIGRSKSARTNQASAPTTAVPPHMKASPIPSSNSSSRHRSASPRGLGRSPKPRYYEPTDSDSSSDEEVTRAKYAPRRASHDHRATSRRSPIGPPRAAYRHSRRDSEDSEQDVPIFKSSKHHPDGPPRSRKVSINPEPSEGFQSHRTRVEAERNQHSAPSTAHAKPPLHTSQPWNSEYPKPVEKSKSWYEMYGSKEDGNKRKEYDRPTTAEAMKSPNMYAQFVSFPSPTPGLSPHANPSVSSRSPPSRVDGRYAYRSHR